MASTLRNNEKIEESIKILEFEKENYSDELDDAVLAFLALSLSEIGEERKGLSLALTALSKNLPRYNNSVLNYAKKLS